MQKMLFFILIMSFIRCSAMDNNCIGTTENFFYHEQYLRKVLKHALRNDDANALKEFFEDGGSIDQNFLKNSLMLRVFRYCACENNLLMYAAAHGKTSILQELVKRYGIDYCCCASERTPLFYSAPEFVEYFVQNGADLNKQDYLGKTPLMHAVENGWLEKAKILIDHGARIDISKRFDNQSLLDISRLLGCSSGKSTEMHAYLSRVILDRCIRGCNTIEQFLEESTPWSTKLFTLNEMAREDFNATLRILKPEGKWIKEFNNSILLEHAVRLELPQAAEFLLQETDVPKKESLRFCQNLLHWAKFKRNWQIFELVFSFVAQKAQCYIIKDALQWLINLPDIEASKAIFDRQKHHLSHVSTYDLCEIFSSFPKDVYTQRDDIIDFYAGTIAIRNQSIVTLLLCLKHYPHYAVREIYRQKLVTEHIRDEYWPVAKLSTTGLTPKVRNILPALDPANVNETYARFLGQAREKFLHEEKEREERERIEREIREQVERDRIERERVERELRERQEAERRTSIEAAARRRQEEGFEAMQMDFEGSQSEVIGQQNDVAVQKACCILQ